MAKRERGEGKEEGKREKGESDEGRRKIKPHGSLK